MSRLISDESYKKLNEVARVNLYGEVAVGTANLKSILAVNAYCSDSWYRFSKYNELKIYCE